MMKELLKQWKVTLVFVLVVLSIIIIAPLPNQKGVIVNSITPDSPFVGKVNVGEIITWANEKDINSPDDLYAFDNFTGTLRFIHSGKLDLVNIETPGLGLTVSKIPSSNLQFGLDLVGGTRILLKPKGNVTDAAVQQTLATLETRINVFGLREANFQSIKDVSGNTYIQIEMAGGSRAEIENLLAKQGKFEGKIPREITFNNGVGTLELENTYTLTLTNNSIEVNNTVLKLNDTSTLDGIPFQVENLTENSATLLFTVFTGDDIQSVCLQDQPGICTSRILLVKGGYEFNFQVFLTQDSAENFAKVTKSMKIITDPNTGSKYLEDKIYLYLDENLITDLSISSELKGQAYTTPAITGFRTTREDALNEQLTLKSILQSGALPVSLDIVRVDEISPALGKEFFQATLIAIIVASIAVAIVIYIRYRSFKILVPNMLWSFFELMLTLGVAALINWTLDLASIAGIIAAIGSGTNDQIMIIDEILEGGSEEERKIYNIKQRIKRAFFIVLGSAATVMVAVIPMMFIGIGAMKGFAVTTLIGVFIGAVITRPAFAIVAEKVLEGKVKQKSEVKKGFFSSVFSRFNKPKVEVKTEEIKKEAVNEQKVENNLKEENYRP